MSWIEELVKTYDDNEKIAGSFDIDDKYVLPPIGHMMQNAQIEITLDGQGNLRRAGVVPKEEKETLIPCTPASASRTLGAVPHPLYDNLQYVARDYELFVKRNVSNDKSPYMMYKELLKSWVTSSFSNIKVRAVYTYISQHNMIHDLIDKKIIYTNDDGTIMDKWIKKNIVKPPIFDVVPGNILKSFVRFRVDLCNGTNPDMWKDREVQQSYIHFFQEHLEVKKTICYATGKMLTPTDKHYKAIRYAGDGAKLISSNDTSGFTFRGRFDSGNQCVTIGYETSQKAMNALKWLIRNQGKNYYGRIFLVWGTEKIPDVFSDTEYLTWPERKKYDSIRPKTMKEWANILTRTIEGYRHNKSKKSKVNIMIMDAATPGRLSICYYQEMDHEQFIDRIERWHVAGQWRQHSFDNERQQSLSYLGVPLPKHIIKACYGDSISENKEKMELERIFYCIVQGKALSRDIITSAINRVIKRAIKAVGKEWYQWYQQLLEPTCSLICNQLYYEKLRKNVMKNKFRNEEVYTVALDVNNTNRSYLYGRLLAVADKIERSTFLTNTDRLTNAMKYMNAFAERPFKTWQMIQLKLIPYQAKINKYGGKETHLIHEIGSMFNLNEFSSNDPLDGKFLLGYYCQSYEFEKQIEEAKRLKIAKEVEKIQINKSKEDNLL